MKLWLEAASRADVGRVNGAVQAGYREHGMNMHRTTYAGAITDLRESLRVFQAVLGQEPAERAGGHALELTARAALAREALLLAGVEQAEADGPPDAAEALAGFAAQCWPEVRDTSRWRTYERRRRQEWRPAERVLVKAMHAGRWKVRWRRWRRYGT
jgi:hypothetical protein